MFFKRYFIFALVLCLAAPALAITPRGLNSTLKTHENTPTLANRIDAIASTQGDGTGAVGQNVSGTTITGATNATPIVMTVTAHGYSDGDFVTQLGTTGNTAANGVFIVANKTDNTYELTDSDGDNVAGNGAFSAGGESLEAFVVKPPADKIYNIKRLNLFAEDTLFKINSYMNISALTNGIQIEVRNAAGLVKSLTPTSVKTFNEWGLYSGPVDTVAIDATANAIGGMRWTFVRGSSDIKLDGSAGEYIAIKIQDDLTGLVNQKACFQGFQTGLDTTFTTLYPNFSPG